MRKLITRFDPVIVRIVGKLPHNLQKPFDVIGYCTTPIVWATVLFIWLALESTNDSARLEHVAIVLAVPLATILKLFIRRTRPPTLYAENMRVRSYSFPSSHAYTAALGFGYIISRFLENGQAFAAMCAGIVVVIIGVSRVHLGAHYPSDVAAGWMLGIVIALSALYTL